MNLVKLAHKLLDKPVNATIINSSERKIKKHLKNLKNTGDVIKVAFIVQMPEVWDKQRDTYEAMVEDARFDVWLVVVPSFNTKTLKRNNYGYEREYYRDKYPDGQFIDAVDNSGKVINLKDYHFDYVFYERPYDLYLPSKLRSSKVCGFSKVCYIPYSTPDFKVPDPLPIENIYRSLYFGFINSKHRQDAINRYIELKGLKNRHIIDVGYPILGYCNSIPENTSDKVSIMWGPRWSYDAEMGGSHFVEYMYDFPKLTERFDNLSLIARPHPMTFPEMVRSGKMTEKEVEEYKEYVAKQGVILDKNKMIEDTFKETDILISDLSSILWLFFFTGRPIIYCPCKIKLSPDLQQLVDLMYVAESWEDVSGIIEKLLAGVDEMREKREEFIRDYFKKYSNPVESIMELIIDDYNKAKE